MRKLEKIFKRWLKQKLTQKLLPPLCPVSLTSLTSYLSTCKGKSSFPGGLQRQTWFIHKNIWAEVELSHAFSCREPPAFQRNKGLVNIHTRLLHVCVYVCTCVYDCIQRTGVGVRCLPPELSFSSFETRSLTDPRLMAD